MDPTIESLTRCLRALAAERDREQFHSPKNLACALSVDAAELRGSSRKSTERT